MQNLCLLKSYWGSAAGRKPADKNTKLCQLVSPSNVDQRKCDEIIGSATTTAGTEPTPTTATNAPTTSTMGGGAAAPSVPAAMLVLSGFLVSLACQ